MNYNNQRRRRGGFRSTNRRGNRQNFQKRRPFPERVRRNNFKNNNNKPRNFEDKLDEGLERYKKGGNKKESHLDQGLDNYFKRSGDQKSNKLDKGLDDYWGKKNE